MIIQEALSWSIKILQNQSASPALDGEVLLSRVLKKTKEYLFAHPDKLLSKLEISEYRNLIARRSKLWPVAYLTHHKEFYGLDFLVTPDVLIPRPETELLIELALARIMNQELGIRNILDIGTGTGNIIISIAKSLHPVIASPDVRLRRIGAKPSQNQDIASSQAPRNEMSFFATDSSQKVIQLARLNARHHGVLNKIKFLRGHLLSPFFTPSTGSGNKKFFFPEGIRRGGRVGHHALKSVAPASSSLDCYGLRLARDEPEAKRPTARGDGPRRGVAGSLIIANFPYLTPQEYSSNPDLKHEPRSALVGGKDGLKYFKELFEQLEQSSHSEDAKGGRRISHQKRFFTHVQNDKFKFTLLVEHSPTQKSALTKLVKKYFPSATKIYRGNLGGQARPTFHKDLGQKYRVMEIRI